MRVQLLLSALVAGTGAGLSTCQSKGKEFLCDDLPLFITTYNKFDGNHYYLQGGSAGKNMNIVKEDTVFRMMSTDAKYEGSRYYVKDQKDRFMEAQHEDQEVSLTNRGDEGGKWNLKYDPGAPDRFNIFTHINDPDTTESNDMEFQSQGSRRRRWVNKNYLSVASSGTDVKLLEENTTDGRDWWYIDPAFCAIIDNTKIYGYWNHVEQIVHEVTEKEIRGYNLNVDAKFHEDFSAKLKAVMRGGFGFGFLKASATVTASVSEKFTLDIDADLNLFSETEFDVTWTKDDVGKHVWQFVVDMVDQGTGDCKKPHTLKTAQLQLTSGDADKDTPCCLPGGFHKTSWDTCISKDYLIPGNDKVCKTKSQDEFTV